MPYNIYDNRGNKIGQVTSPAEEAAAFVLLIYALPFFIAIGLIILAYQGFTQVYWPWAKMAHSLTRYANLNGVITCLAIPMVSFAISARWEKIARGEIKLLTEFCWIAAIVYSAIGIVSAIPIVSDVPPQEVNKWFIIAPVAASTLTYLRFKPIRLIVGLLIAIPILLIGLVIIVTIAWSIINAVGSWLFR